jgi:hypothetical protein
MSEYQFSDREVREITEEINLDEVTDEDGDFKREELEEKIKNITKGREYDPTYYEGLWMSNVTKVKRALREE